MEQLGRSEKYLRELFRLTRANRIPADWGTPRASESGAESIGKVASRMLSPAKQI